MRPIHFPTNRRILRVVPDRQPPRWPGRPLQHRSRADGAGGHFPKPEPGGADALGPDSALGQGSENSLYDDQCLHRDAHPASGLSRVAGAHRCLVPASSYYEWKTEERGKIPYYIHPAHGSFVAFAGLYDTWTNAQDEELRTFTIVTRDADDQIARLHNRMPVVLAQEDEQAWLDSQLTAPS